MQNFLKCHHHKFRSASWESAAFTKELTEGKDWNESFINSHFAVQDDLKPVLATIALCMADERTVKDMHAPATAERASSTTSIQPSGMFCD